MLTLAVFNPVPALCGAGAQGKGGYFNTIFFIPPRYFLHSDLGVIRKVSL